jgi:hypothetical protein
MGAVNGRTLLRSVATQLGMMLAVAVACLVLVVAVGWVAGELW